MKAKYSDYVHEFVDHTGRTRYAVAEWVESAGQYQCPLDNRTQKLSGCRAEFSRTLDWLGGYPTRRQALRRARYLFGTEQEV